MSSPCRIRAAGAAALALSVCGCHRAEPGWTPPRGQVAAPLPRMSHLYPGGAPPGQAAPQLTAFENDPAHVSNGKRYYTAYNCTGCHFNGGGGIGPAFMDQKWRYGGSLEEIHDSIAEGRPNGMPVWGRMIPDAQIWEIAAYVRSMSAQAPATAAGRPAPPTPGAAAASPGGRTAPAG
jgi:cytochrome c oxidase cbb3-type subunit 3